MKGFLGRWLSRVGLGRAAVAFGLGAQPSGAPPITPAGPLHVAQHETQAIDVPIGTGEAIGVAIEATLAIEVVIGCFPMLPGNVCKVRCQFTDKDSGAFVDPVAVRMILLLPLQKPSQGATSTYLGALASSATFTVQALVRESLGHYRADILIPGTGFLTGRYTVRFEGDGSTAIIGAGESSFRIEQSTVVV